jgi:hypothetical protein
MTTSTHGEPPRGGAFDECGPVTADEMRLAFRAAEGQIDAGYRHQRDDCPLPEFWDDPECCDAQTLYSIEVGIERWEPIDDFDLEARTMHGHTQGWDAMSEQGMLEYLECIICHKVWAKPEDLDWD